MQATNTTINYAVDNGRTWWLEQIACPRSNCSHCNARVARFLFQQDTSNSDSTTAIQYTQSFQQRSRCCHSSYTSFLPTAGATREFPVKFQVDLIFPKNETYALTSYFPVVYAVHNFRAAGHLDLYLHGTIKTYKSRRFLLDESTRGYGHD